MNRFAELFAQRRWPFLAAVVMCSLLAAWGNARLEFDDAPRAIFASDDEDYARLLEFYETFGADDNDTLFVLETDDWFQPTRAELLRDLARAAQQVPGVERVLSLADVITLDGLLPRSLLPPSDASPEAFAMAKVRALEHPLVDGRLVSPDGRLAMMVARLEPDATRIEDMRPGVVGLQALLRERTEGTGVTARVTGIPPIRVEIFDTVRSEQLLFMGLGALFCVVLAWVFFRDVGSVVAAVLPAGIGAFWALGAVALVGGKIDILGSVLSTIVLVIGFTDSVHLVMDVRRSLHDGESRLAAAVDAIRHVGLPCLLTSFTTAVGFASLATSPIAVIRTFGGLAALSVLVAFTAVILTAPLLIVFLPRVGAARRPAGEAVLPWERRAGAFIDGISRRARVVSACGVGFSLLAALLCTRLLPENRLTEALPRGESYGALMAAEQAFGGILPLVVVVGWDTETAPPLEERMEVLRDVEESLSSLPGAHAPLSARQLAGLLPRADPASALAVLPPELVTRYLREDRGQAVVEVLLPDAGGRTTRALVEGLQQNLEALRQRHSDFSFHPTGTDYVARTNVNRMIVGLARSLGFAAFVIFVVIAFEFRSIRLGLLSLLPNVFPLVLIGAILALTTGALQMASAVLFTVLMGLAVDDTIHFLSRYRRERERGLEVHAALRESFLRVGQAVGVTTLVLGAGFATVAFSSVPTNQQFALYITLGLVAALIGDLVFLPALLAAFPSRQRRPRGV